MTRLRFPLRPSHCHDVEVTFAGTYRLSAIGRVVAGAALCAPLSALAPAAADDPCPNVQVVFARGTNEPVGPGFTGQTFIDALSAKLPAESVAAYAVNYPASDDYVRSAAVGADDARAKIQATAANCPATKLVLGGYSQGAAVTELATSAMPPQIADHVAAVALFGTPVSEFSRMLAGGATLPTLSPSYAAKTLDLCITDDPICSAGANTLAHLSYITSGLTEQAATFAAARVGQDSR